MSSYVYPLMPPAMLVVPLLLARWLRRGRRTIDRRWTAAALVCLAVGLAIAPVGRPAHLIAAEDAAAAASQEADAPQQDAGAAKPADAAESAPAEPAAVESAAAKAAPAKPVAEVPGSEEGEKPVSGEGEGEPASGGEAGQTEEAAPESEAEQADAEEVVRIESWWARTAFNLSMLIVLAVVVIGPFYWWLGVAKNWRQPLWGWPIGLVVFAVAAVAAVTLIRWVFSFLPPEFGKVFESYLDTIVGLSKLWITVALIAVPIWLGAYLSRKWRMPDYSGRIAVVFFALFAGMVITILGWPPKLGIDLSGGVILVYELEDEPAGGESGQGGVEEGAPGEGEADEQEAAPQRGKVDMDKLIQAIRLRADPSNIRELTIRARGERQIEVIIPLSQAAVQQKEGEEAKEGENGPRELEELERIKKKISSAGTLEFRILANRRKHGEYIKQILEQGGQELRDAQGNLLAWWVRVAQGEEEDLLRLAESAETVYRTTTGRDGTEWTEFLVVKDIFDVNGGFLVDSRPSIDQSGRPCVLFTFNHRGGQLFGALTGNNLPEKEQDFSYHLGIILDRYLQSAPAIRSTIFQRGEITGDFTSKEVEDLVDILNAGSLPTALSEHPVSETRMGPGLGQDTIDRGKIAIGVSIALVLLFMVIYYRFAGIVACGALVMTLMMVLAIMISVGAAFTLPGLAGLVLTVGMAVDANVLIFERIREELAKKAALRMAIRNGFGRATSAIVDANLTTLITATVLYVIGTDQIKGFAVTLWLGVVLSMFTAIYCSRVVFDVAEKQKWITQLGMLRILRKTEIDFLGMRRLAAAASGVVIVVGLAAVCLRGAGLLDIDFTGGVSIHAVFNEHQDIAQIRDKLGEQGEGLEDLSVMDVRALGQDVSGKEFIINTSGPRDMSRDAQAEDVLAEVKRRLQNAFGPDLARHSMTVKLESEGDAPEPDEETAAPAPETETRNQPPDAPLVAGADLSSVLLLRAEPSEPVSEAPQEKPPSTDAKAEEPSAETTSTEKPAEKPTQAELRFKHKVRYETLTEQFRGEIRKLQEAGTLPDGAVRFELFVDDYVTVDNEDVRNDWHVEVHLPPDQGKALLDAVKQQVESEPVFPSSNTIGGQVARGTRVDAVAALLASLMFIVGYIWIRFQRVMFGLAAVVALVHDVLITLGVIALTAYLAPVMGWLLIDEFKIGLAVLAAFLTIIGYSLNDTIVVFDRIREVRGKAPRLTAEMINSSINQTLSRTLLTSLTTLLVVVVLYIGGGQAIHVFAFALVVGVVVGTYSSIFVASPVLFWMARSANAKPKGRRLPQTP